MKLPLITVPNPLLRQKSKPIETLDKKAAQFIADLVETLVKKENPQGVGLSAVQVGKLWRVFAVNLPPIFDMNALSDKAPASEIKVFINPEIVDKSDKMTLGPDKRKPIPEGCLSIPSLYGPVPRHVWVKVKYFTLGDATTRRRDDELIEKTEVFANFYGRVVQHEYDHLDGILFTDYTLKHKEELYFDQDDRLVEVPQPEKLICW